MGCFLSRAWKLRSISEVLNWVLLLSAMELMAVLLLLLPLLLQLLLCRGCPDCPEGVVVAEFASVEISVGAR